MSSRTQIQVFGHIVFSFTRDMSEYYFLFFFLCFGAFSLANFSLSIISLRAWSSSVYSQAIPEAFFSWRISVLFLLVVWIIEIWDIPRAWRTTRYTASTQKRNKAARKSFLFTPFNWYGRKRKSIPTKNHISLSLVDLLLTWNFGWSKPFRFIAIWFHKSPLSLLLYGC